jgi:hypothetical protein
LLSLSIATTPVFNSVENARIILGGCRILISLTISLVILFLTAADSRNSDEENARLLSQEGNSSEYGTSCDIESEIEERRATTMKILKKIQASGNWWEYAKSYSVSFLSILLYNSNRDGKISDFLAFYLAPKRPMASDIDRADWSMPFGNPIPECHGSSPSWFSYQCTYGW